MQRYNVHVRQWRVLTLGVLLRRARRLCGRERRARVSRAALLARAARTHTRAPGEAGPAVSDYLYIIMLTCDNGACLPAAVLLRRTRVICKSLA